MREVAVRPARRLAGDAIDERVGGDHHPAHVLREVAREPRKVVRHLREQPPRAVLGTLVGRREFRHASLALNLLPHLRRAVIGLRTLGDAVDLGLGQAERPADVAHRAADAVRGEDRDERGVVSPPVLVHALDELLPDVARKVEVDVRQRQQRVVEEAVDREAVADRVDVRQANEVADQRGDRRPASSAWRQLSDAARTARAAHLLGDLDREPHHLEVDEEEPCQSVHLDHLELVLKAVERGLTFVQHVLREQPLHADTAEFLDRRQAALVLGVGQAVAKVLGEIEGAASRDADGVRRGLRVVRGEAPGLLLR